MSKALTRTSVLVFFVPKTNPARKELDLFGPGSTGLPFVVDSTGIEPVIAGVNPAKVAITFTSPQ